MQDLWKHWKKNKNRPLLLCCNKKAVLRTLIHSIILFCVQGTYACTTEQSRAGHRHPGTGSRAASRAESNPATGYGCAQTFYGSRFTTTGLPRCPADTANITQDSVTGSLWYCTGPWKARTIPTTQATTKKAYMVYAYKKWQKWAGRYSLVRYFSYKDRFFHIPLTP